MVEALGYIAVRQRRQASPIGNGLLPGRCAADSTNDQIDVKIKGNDYDSAERATEPSPDEDQPEPPVKEPPTEEPPVEEPPPRNRRK